MSPSQMAQKIKELQKELKRTQQQREILKDAVVFLANKKPKSRVYERTQANTSCNNDVPDIGNRTIGISSFYPTGEWPSSKREPEIDR
jgi:DNA polymerase III gamma/tau subunit